MKNFIQKLLSDKFTYKVIALDYLPVGILILIFAINNSSCKKIIEVDSPPTSVTGSSVYTTDATAVAAVTSIYSGMSLSSSNLTEGITNISLLSGLSADELTLNVGFSTNIQNAYYRNALATNIAGYEYWNIIYQNVYKCNAAIEGLNSSNSLTAPVKQQLIGEAKFLRAFFYFYLVNLYGNVPLVLETDYKVNSILDRSLKSIVYEQIIDDLKEAQSLLNEVFVGANVLSVTKERVRPTKWAATALLARVYLYNGDWDNAEAQASLVINNPSLFSLNSLSNVFLKNSNEAIWQLQPVNTGAYSNTADAVFFIIPSTGPSSSYPVYLSNHLLNSFETGDLRKTNWVNSVTVNGVTYYYPYKYKVNANGAAVTEYFMILRLGEQYLIRGEARARQGNLLGASADLNTIRTRGGLSNTVASTQASLLTAIQHERQVEMFTELGHRWLDLKRTGNVETVMLGITPQKGGSWNSNWQLYPIPGLDIQRNVNLIQNDGY